MSSVGECDFGSLLSHGLARFMLPKHGVGFRIEGLQVCGFGILRLKAFRVEFGLQFRARNKCSLLAPAGSKLSAFGI